MQLRSAMELFLQDRLLAGLAQSSIQEYSYQLGILLRYLDTLSIHDTAEITVEHVRRFLYERRQHVKQSSVCHARSILKLWITWLNARGESRADPDKLPSVALPKSDEIRRVRFTDQQTQRFFGYLKRRLRRARTEGSRFMCLQNLACAGLLFGAGLRISEVADAQIRHLDLAGRELYIPRSKGNRERYAALSPTVAGYLRLYMRYRRKLRTKSPYLIASAAIEQYATTTLARRLQKEASAIGLEMTTHTGRRYCITKLARWNVYAAQDQAGHADLKTTRMYVAEDRGTLRQTVREHDPLH